MNSDSIARHRLAAAKIHELLLRCMTQRQIMVRPPAAPATRHPLPKAGHRSGFGSDSILPYLNR